MRRSSLLLADRLLARRAALLLDLNSAERVDLASWSGLKPALTEHLTVAPALFHRRGRSVQALEEVEPASLRRLLAVGLRMHSRRFADEQPAAQ